MFEGVSMTVLASALRISPNAPPLRTGVFPRLRAGVFYSPPPSHGGLRGFMVAAQMYSALRPSACGKRAPNFVGCACAPFGGRFFRIQTPPGGRFSA